MESFIDDLKNYLHISELYERWCKKANVIESLVNHDLILQPLVATPIDDKLCSFTHEVGGLEFLEIDGKLHYRFTNPLWHITAELKYTILGSVFFSKFEVTHLEKTSSFIRIFITEEELNGKPELITKRAYSIWRKEHSTETLKEIWNKRKVTRKMEFKECQDIKDSERRGILEDAAKELEKFKTNFPELFTDDAKRESDLELLRDQNTSLFRELRQTKTELQLLKEKTPTKESRKRHNFDEDLFTRIVFALQRLLMESGLSTYAALESGVSNILYEEATPLSDETIKRLLRQCRKVT